VQFLLQVLGVHESSKPKLLNPRPWQGSHFILTDFRKSEFVSSGFRMRVIHFHTRAHKQIYDWIFHAAPYQSLQLARLYINLTSNMCNNKDNQLKIIILFKQIMNDDKWLFSNITRTIFVKVLTSSCSRSSIVSFTSSTTSSEILSCKPNNVQDLLQLNFTHNTVLHSALIIIIIKSNCWRAIMS